MGRRTSSLSSPFPDLPLGSVPLPHSPSPRVFLTSSILCSLSSLFTHTQPPPLSHPSPTPPPPRPAHARCKLLTLQLRDPSGNNTGLTAQGLILLFWVQKPKRKPSSLPFPPSPPPPGLPPPLPPLRALDLGKGINLFPLLNNSSSGKDANCTSDFFAPLPAFSPSHVKMPGRAADDPPVSIPVSPRVGAPWPLPGERTYGSHRVG